MRNSNARLHSSKIHALETAKLHIRTLMDTGSGRICLAPNLAQIMLFIFAGVFFQGCGERPESSYPLLADATDAGAVTRGWIPNFLPESSHDIHEMHDITSSRTWCSFQFSPNDAQRFRDSLVTSLDELPQSLRHIDSPHKPWWPDFLENGLDAKKLHDKGFMLYVVEEPSIMDQTRPVFFAIDWIKGRGFFHRTYSR
jgi:hypothetical protein